MMMINIFICEDQTEQRDRITEIIYNYILMENLDMKIALAISNPYELLKYIKERDIVDGLYFLGVDLATTLNGVELAVEIRKYDKRCLIAFVSDNTAVIELNYKYFVEALTYISKKNVQYMEQGIRRCLYLAQERLVTNKKRRYVFREGDKILSQPYNDILYFEKSVVDKNKVKIITFKESFEFYGTLKEVEDAHESFYRVGGSYVFNMDNVKGFVKSRGEVVMTNELKCCIPMKHAKIFSKNIENKEKYSRS